MGEDINIRETNEIGAGAIQHPTGTVSGTKTFLDVNLGKETITTEVFQNRLSNRDLLQQILKELKVANMYNELITEDKIRENETED